VTPAGVQRIAVWRVAAAIAILAGLVFFTILFAPIYFHNLQLENFVAGAAANARSQSQPDTMLRNLVLARARQLDLPVQADNVQIYRSADGIRIEVRYFVRVSFPGYTVDLHFSGNR
jgi:hypothetical protein